MQVDLFKDSEIRANGQRLSPQIETRKCLIEPKSLMNFPNEIEGLESNRIKQYKWKIDALAKKSKRIYAYRCCQFR